MVDPRTISEPLGCGFCRLSWRWCSDCSRALVPRGGLLLGWAAGILWGSWTAWSNGLKPLATIDLCGTSYVFYVDWALILNVAVAAIATLIVGRLSPRGATARS